MRFNLKKTAAVMATFICLSAPLANAAGFNFATNSPFAKKIQALKPCREFRGQKPWNVNDLSADEIRHSAIGTKNVVDVPLHQYSDISQFDYLEGPDGSTWFYTTEFDKTYVEHNEWYTEEFINAYTFTIYDELFNEIGKISDKVTLADDEKKIASVTLDPALTFNFFNTDDNLEVMVYIAANTVSNINNYYYKVYSLGGEKDADGNDIAIRRLEGRCVDAVNSPGADGEENFFLTFAEDVIPNVDDFDDFLDYINAYANRVIVYAKASDDNGPRVISEKNIYLSNIPGDTTDGIYLITKPVNGVLYLIYSYYEKPYFVDPTGFAQDESATEDNYLVIETFKTTGDTPELVSTTKIPVEIEEVDNQLCYTFYSIGSVTWKNDVDMTVNGTPEAPAFIVARDWCKAATLEDVLSSYDIYGNDGRLIRNLADDTESLMVLADVPGKQPQIMFIGFNENGEYVYRFVDLYSCETVFTLESDNGGDTISSACDRVAMPDGTVKYAFEMKMCDEDDEGNVYARVGWFNADGSLDRYDSINLGKDVEASMVNMASYVLSPYLYDDDDYMEYAVLVKRKHGRTTRNEFVIADHDGKHFANISEDDGKGLPHTFTIVPGKEKHHLMMLYALENNNFNIDLYALPFLNSAEDMGSVDSVFATDSAVSFDGTTVRAIDSVIDLYDATGRKVARGNDAVNVSALGAGVYVVVATDAQGQRTVVKIAL